ncbi:MAG: hypothetical protein ACXVIJ_11955, partial [Thermoanaerobaculia bacterium]
ENLADLYSNVLFYEGRPTQMQVERTDALARELTDVVTSFDQWLSAQLTGLNADLTKRKLDPIRPLTKEEWQKQSSGSE